MIDLASVVKPVDGAERHGLVASGENGGLVHVIPESADAQAYEIFLQRAPPGARSRKRELRKRAGTRPNPTDPNPAIGIPYKTVSRDSLFIRPVTGHLGDVKIGDENCAEPLAAKVLNHSFNVREIFPIDGEGAIPVLIINVQVNDVRGDLFRAESLCQLPNLG